MGQRRQRSEAVTKLKDALTRQFGEQARSHVEAHVEAHLSGSKGQIGRQDLDAIEKGILGSLRQQRGSKKTDRLSKSAPFLPAATGSTASAQEATIGAFPPPTSKQIPKVPIGTSNPGTLARASSDSGISMPTIPINSKKKKPPPAPYSTSIGGTNPYVDESARSGVKLQARYPVPLPPKLKPMDHFDLMVAFDSHKYRNEERELVERGNHERMMRFKKVLDDQMVEVQEGRDNEARGKEEERIMMAAQVEENKRYHQEEMDIHDKKKNEQSRINTSMLGDINKYKEKEVAKRKREEEEMTAWLAEEKRQLEEDQKNQAIEYAMKCERAKKDLDDQRRDREERRLADMENEKRLMKLRDQIADEQEAKKQKALQDRKDHIDKIAATMGADVAARDAQGQADLEAKIKKIQEDANRAAMEDAQNRFNTHAKKIKDMVTTRQQQVREKNKDDAEEKAQGLRDLARFQAEVAEDNRKEKAKQDKRRLDRENLDKTLIEQMRINAGIHEQHIMMTPRNRKTELEYNKALFAQMRKEEFMVDQIDHVHSKPTRAHHPEGKLIMAPGIPRYTGEIHPIELEQPDV